MNCKGKFRTKKKFDTVQEMFCNNKIQIYVVNLEINLNFINHFVNF